METITVGITEEAIIDIEVVVLLVEEGIKVDTASLDELEENDDILLDVPATIVLIVLLEILKSLKDGVINVLVEDLVSSLELVTGVGMTALVAGSVVELVATMVTAADDVIEEDDTTLTNNVDRGSSVVVGDANDEVVDENMKVVMASTKEL